MTPLPRWVAADWADFESLARVFTYSSIRTNPWVFSDEVTLQVDEKFFWMIHKCGLKITFYDTCIRIRAPSRCGEVGVAGASHGYARHARPTVRRQCSTKSFINALVRSYHIPGVKFFTTVSQGSASARSVHACGPSLHAHARLCTLGCTLVHAPHATARVVHA